MIANWVADETADVDFGDARLDLRYARILSALGVQPQASLPVALGGRNELDAAYEFFDNFKVSPEEILGGHFAATHRRIDQVPVAILAQDTTEIDVTRPHSVVSGAGPLDGGTRRGGLLHPMVAFTPEGTPLGVVACEWWIREEVDAAATKPTRAERASTPIGEKESLRWVTTLREAHAVSARHPSTQIVCVADSESDIHEVLLEGQKAAGSAKWIVRSAQNRVLVPPEAGKTQENQEDSGEDGATLRSRLLAQPILSERTISVRERHAKVSNETRKRRQSREARTAKLEVRATAVTVRGPWRPGGILPNVTVNAVLVRERDVPEGEEPVEWLLLTNLPIHTLAAVEQVIGFYTQRWMIEVYFRVLKSGCRLESRRFESMDRIWNVTAVCLVVAWRTLLVCRLGRELPDVSCEAVFEPSEWQSVYRVVTDKNPPSEPPRLREMVRMVASLGGFVNRAKGSEPGPETIWKGLQRMRDYAHAWELFGPGRNDEST